MFTERQLEILRFIAAHQEENGYPPTRAEIARHFGFGSVNAVSDHLDRLARKGALRIEPGLSRGLRILAPVEGLRDGRKLPPDELAVVGRVAAGTPIDSEENVEKTVKISGRAFRPRAHYLLRVRGESMRDAGIRDGDLLAVHRSETAGDGDIVVARVDGEVTVKRFVRSRPSAPEIELRPENPAFRPLVIDTREERLKIEGIAVGVLRLYD